MLMTSFRDRVKNIIPSLISFFSHAYDDLSHVGLMIRVYFLCCFNPRNNSITNLELVHISRDSSDDIDDQQAGAADYYNLIKGTKKAALTIALFIAATDAALIINTVVPVHFCFLVAPYNTLLNLSLFISVGLSIYSLMNITTTDTDAELIVWVLRILVGLGLFSILIALVLRGLMVQTYSSLKLAWILFVIFVVVIVVGLIFLYLWMVRKKKKKRINNIRTLPSTPEGVV